MKTTVTFKATIEEHLRFVAFQDPLFAETLKKSNKNIDDCCNYILNTVKDSGINGFEDGEIYQMAIHYYDEDDIKVGAKSANAKVIVNHTVHLTQEEINEARKEARDKVISEEMAKMRKKPQKTVVTTTEKADDKSAPGTLF